MELDPALEDHYEKVLAQFADCARILARQVDGYGQITLEIRNHRMKRILKQEEFLLDAGKHVANQMDLAQVRQR